MTAVTTQLLGEQQLTAHSSQSRHQQPQPQPQPQAPLPQLHSGSAALVSHGTTSTMPSVLRGASAVAVADEVANGGSNYETRPTGENGHSTTNHSAPSLYKRPSSAPDDKPPDISLLTTGMEDQRPHSERRVKPMLLRSKSEHPGRGIDSGMESNDEQTVANAEDCGTRHGFDGHYQSEDIISQLANVSCAFSLWCNSSPMCTFQPFGCPPCAGFIVMDCQKHIMTLTRILYQSSQGESAHLYFEYPIPRTSVDG